MRFESTVMICYSWLRSASIIGIRHQVAVNGTATFSNLSINQIGSYTLTATDTTSSSISAATSSLFKITSEKLVFLKAPTRANAGEAIQPNIEVALEFGKHKIDTTDSTTVVTLSPIGLSAGNPITGDTATMVNGIATFSNVVLTKPGTYQLQAADGSDTAAATGKFKVTGLHMAMLKQPADVSFGDAVVCGVALEDAKNKVVTSDSSDYAFIAYYAAGSTSVIDGDFVPLNQGVGNLNAASAFPIIIKKPDTYYLVVDEATNGQIDTDTAYVKSVTFKVLASTT